MAKFSMDNLNENQILGGNLGIIGDMNEAIEFKDGKPTGVSIGVRYQIVCPLKHFEQVSVLVAGEPIISQEELDKRNESLKFVFVRFENLSGKIWQDFKTKEIRKTASADKIIIVNEKGAKSNE